MATMFCMCISIIAMLWSSVCCAGKSGAADLWTKPTVQVIMVKCDVKDGKLELETLYLNTIERQDINMCYIKPGETNCMNFEKCVQKPGELMNSVKCVTFNQSDNHSYDLRLKFGKDDTSTIVMNHFIPATYRFQCIGGWPTSGFGPGLGFRYTGSMINYAVVSKTPYAMTIQANLSRGIYSTLRNVDIKFESNDRYPVLTYCNISSVDQKSSICHVEGLNECTRYNICINMYTSAYRRLETCFNDYSGYVAPFTPGNFVGFSLDGYDGYYRQSILRWDPVEEFNNQYDRYYIEYYADGAIQKEWIRESQAIVNAELNRAVSLRYCSRCGCSKDITRNIFKFNYQKAESNLRDQIEKWQETDRRRQNMWTGVMGGIGGGFFVALIVAAVYIRNKRKRSSERNGLLASSKRVTYSNFGHETEQSPL